MQKRMASTMLIGLVFVLTSFASGALGQEKKITRAEATDIIASLSDNTIWVFDAPQAAYRNWITGFRRDGDRIAITSSWPIRPTWGTWVRERTMTFSVLFPKFCTFPRSRDCSCDSDGFSRENNVIYCGVRGDYTFQIVSDKKVIVDAVEKWPRIPGTTAPTTYRFEYTQFR